MEKSLGLDKKAKWRDTCCLYAGGCWRVQGVTTRHVRMVGRPQADQEEFQGLVSGASGRAFQGPGKENYSDISKACYSRHIRTMDRAHLRSRLTFAEEAIGLRRDCSPRLSS